MTNPAPTTPPTLAERVSILVSAATAAGLDSSPSVVNNPELHHLVDLLRVRRQSLHTDARVYIHAIDARIHRTGPSNDVPYAASLISINALKRGVVKLAAIQAGIELLEHEQRQQTGA